MTAGLSKKNVLITSAGRRVSLLRAFREQLHARLPGSQVFAGDCRPALSAACADADGAFELPPCTDPQYVPKLIECCDTNGVGLIVPTIDTELLTLAEARHVFAERGISAVVSDPDFIGTCRDKRLTNQFFLAHQIPVPETIDRDNPRFPLFVKPFNGSMSKGVQLIEHPAQLTPEIVADANLMFLEAIDRSVYDEFTVDLYYDRTHRLKCVVPRLRLEVRAGEVSKGLAVRNGILPFLQSRLGKIPGAVGCLTLQLFKHRSEERYYGIEINPRFGGGYPLSYLAGANFPGWLIDEYLLNRPAPEFFDGWEDNLLMLRFDQEVAVHGYRHFS